MFDTLIGPPKSTLTPGQRGLWNDTFLVFAFRMCLFIRYFSSEAYKRTNIKTSLKDYKLF